MAIVARVIDILPSKEVVVIMGHEQFTVPWPLVAPKIGETFAVAFAPDFKILKRLSGSSGLKKDGDAMRWRRPDAQGRTRMEALQMRHIIKRAVRDYLHKEGFLEIDMPLLVHGTTPDAEIESFAVGDRYNTTSTEYQIKRMEIGGFDKIYTLTQNFRKGDLSPFNNPEFTMLEWARVGQSLSDIENDIEQMVFAAHMALGGKGSLHYRGHKINIAPPWRRVSVTKAIADSIGVTIKDFTPASLLQALEKAKVSVREEMKSDTTFLFTILLDHVQKSLGFEQPVFVYDWPDFLTSSAKPRETGKFIERVEVFIAGVELGNGFPSQTNLEQQAASFARQNGMKKQAGKPEVKLDEKYLAAFAEGFPTGAGMAMGFDRLVMLLTDRADINAVLAFGWNEL